MYHMLGHVTETIGGDQWERLVSSRLFEPIGMVDSVMVYEADKNMIELATPYELYRGELREINLDAQITLNAYLGVSGKMLFHPSKIKCLKCFSKLHHNMIYHI